MDDIAVNQIGDFEEGLLSHILDDETEATLKNAVEEFAASFK